MTESDPAGDLAMEFAELNDHLRTADQREVALQRVVDLAVKSVPGCSSAAVTAWPVQRQPRSLATSDEVAAAIDQLQYDLGDGPCLSAASEHESVRIADIRTERRWPTFAEALATDFTIRAVLSFHLVDEPQRSALNLYAEDAEVLDEESFATATLFAAHARVLLMHAASAGRAGNLEHALTTSRQIGSAVGILMHAYKISDEEAFRLLRVTSQRLNRKLADIAQDVADTGTLPRRDPAD
ncbi:GAF and ANTAR domain-containing protein [Luteipulveratus flavus]|uniref:GAF and ANTAR domain-containing protein n=1 Tax=Luteipulveratus flavus TaxID=3031728 RepID=A0ABT6CC46_9MICO|nr:GAF and ANTAR domain-containing protein [Luteipulveratus sp. YIM 133296]MDF8264836.1 GAF and ANTAR domain-containing protein [Luteipulveratus sp. YIM 133296]